MLQHAFLSRFLLPAVLAAVLAAPLAAQPERVVPRLPPEGLLPLPPGVSPQDPDRPLPRVDDPDLPERLREGRRAQPSPRSLLDPDDPILAGPPAPLPEPPAVVPEPDEELQPSPPVPEVPASEADAVSEDLPAVDPVPPVVGAEDSLSLARRAAALLGVVLGDRATAAAEPEVPAPDGVVAQSLARAVFAAPVAGSIPYVIHAEVNHDLTIVFPVDWMVVDVAVGDPDRWAVSRARHLVMLKPGDLGLRTNLTVVFDNGDILQMDLQEVTGMTHLVRTGRVYVGPERWLVDRIFGMLPPDVRLRVARSPATVAELLADPVTVVGLYGGTGAVPSPLAASAASVRRAGADLDVVVPPPTLGALDGVEDDLLPLTVPDPSGGPVPEASSPRGPPPSSLPADVRGGHLPGSGRWVDGPTVERLEADLSAAVARVESARVSAGNRVAAAQLNVQAEMEALRAEYPLRTQFSYLLEPDVDPYTEPFWHFGVWHDGERTFFRLMADDPQFIDEDTGEAMVAVPLRNYLYRFDRLVENGSVVVADADSGAPRTLYFRRRRELEGP